MSNFHALEVVIRGSEVQPASGCKFKLFNLVLYWLNIPDLNILNVIQRKWA